MIYNLGISGLGTLIVMSLAFGALAGVATWRSASHWIGVAGGLAFFLGGLFVSEVMFATATEAELQPNIDGLSLDEAALGGLVLGLAATIVAWFVTRHRHRDQHRPTAA